MEESATDEAVGMQQGDAQIRSLVNRHQGRWVRFAKVDSLCGVQDETPRFKAERLNLNPKCCKVLPALPARAKNGGMGRNNSMFCNEQINYPVRIVSLDLKFVHVNHRECNSHFERQNVKLQKIIFCPISNFKNKISPASDE